MTRPLTINSAPWPDDPANCARPMVPPAPGTFVTSTFLTVFSFCRACCIARAVPSQPPPGEAGAMMDRLSICAQALPAARKLPINAAAAIAGSRLLGLILDCMKIVIFLRVNLLACNLCFFQHQATRQTNGQTCSKPYTASDKRPESAS